MEFKVIWERKLQLVLIYSFKILSTLPFPHTFWLASHYNPVKKHNPKLFRISSVKYLDAITSSLSLAKHLRTVGKSQGY